MFCIHCGKQIADSSKFCEYCGAKVEEAQQPMQQPVYAPYSAPVQKKSSAGKIIVIILAAIFGVAILAAVGVTLWVILHTSTPAEPVEEPVMQQQEEEVLEPEMPVYTGPTLEEYQQQAAYYSTDVMPNFDEFTWFTETGFGRTLPPLLADAMPIPHTALVEGGWKMLIVWDADRTHNAYCWDLQNAYLQTVDNNVSLTVRYGVYYEPDLGYTSDISNNPDDVYAGAWDGLIANTSSSIGSITLYGFYERDGRQYALGHGVAVDGTGADIAMMRP